MPWDRVIGQARAVAALRGAVAAGRVAHAYLFHGPDGVGKRAAALALAQALECERRPEGSGDACGACGPCQKVARLVHPDVHVYFPQPSDAEPSDVAARLARLAEDPYAEVGFRRRPSLDDPTKTSTKQVIYPVGRMREEVGRDLRFTPAEGRYKVALLTDADAMNVEASNAFLKTLEEPTPRTVLILTASRPDRLLPTITSRCQRLRFDALTVEEVERALTERAGLDPTRAGLLARMADGSYTQALTLAGSEELAERREQVLQFFRLAYTDKVGPLDDLISALAARGREPLKATLALMLVWVRDLVLARALGAEAPIVNVDQAEAVHRFVAGVPDADLDAMASLVEHAVELVERNANAALVLTVLADALRQAMLGRSRPRLFTPLAEA
jgi:DNA polymerase III subunit delta'